MISKLINWIWNYIKVSNFKSVYSMYIQKSQYIYIYIYIYIHIKQNTTYILFVVVRLNLFVTRFNYISVFLVCFTCLGYFSNQKRHALTFCEDLSNFQPVNSHLIPFRDFWMMSVPKQPGLKWKSDFYNNLKTIVWQFYTT